MVDLARFSKTITLHIFRFHRLLPACCGTK